MSKRIILILAIMLLLCACSVQVRQNTNIQMETENQLPGTDDTQPTDQTQQTDPTQTLPVVTVPLVPENSDYTGPTLNASESVEDWDDNGGDSGNANSTEATKPEETDPPATQPTEPSDSQTISYEAYLAMSTSEQQAYFLSFENVEDFYTWLDKAEAEYKAAHPEVGGDGSIDIGDYMGNGN